MTNNPINWALSKLIIQGVSDKRKRNNVFFVPIKNYKKARLKKASFVDCYQIRTVSINRLQKIKIGNAIELIDDIKIRVANILEITVEHILP